MVRLAKYTRALASGYLLLGVNAVFLLASIPLALHYLGEKQFGLWAVISQIAGYLALLDFGMSTAVGRILVDHKDQPDAGAYGSTILTSLLVSAVQGFVLAACSFGFAWLGAGPLNIAPALQGEFRLLMAGTGLLQGFLFLGRPLINVLWAQQRTDLSNLILALAFVVNLAGLWAGFKLGYGIKTILYAQGVANVLTLVLCWTACRRCRFLPRAGHWGKVTWRQFLEIFRFGNDVFVYSLGSQMINATQMILIAPCVGLEAAAVWKVCVASFQMLSQVVWRILDYSANPLAEMLVRGEHDRFQARFRAITELTSVAAVAMAACFIAGNAPFVSLLSHGALMWDLINDVLLGVWLVLGAVQRCHCGRLGLYKNLQSVKYVYFLEGALFITLAVCTATRWGLAGVAGSSLAATLCVTWVYGWWKTGRDYRLSWRELAGWLVPAMRAALWLLAPTVLLCWLHPKFPPLAMLIGVVAILGPLAAWVTFRFGVAEEMRQTVLSMFPRLSRWL